jgi:hypothetical protein
MRRHHAIFFVLGILLAPAAQASDVSWIFLPGYYTHSPITGERVSQYQPEKPSLVPIDPTYQESGYRHQTYQIGTDNLNFVQTWGAGTGIRPYGEWERPFRPGATPYGPWWGYAQGPWTTPYWPPNGGYRSPYAPATDGPMTYGGGRPAAGPTVVPAPSAGPNPAVPPTAAPARRGQEL